MGDKQAASPYMGNIHIEVRQDKVLSFDFQLLTEFSPVQKHSKHHPHNPHLIKLLKNIFFINILSAKQMIPMLIF